MNYFMLKQDLSTRNKKEICVHTGENNDQYESAN